MDHNYSISNNNFIKIHNFFLVLLEIMLRGATDS